MRWAPAKVTGAVPSNMSSRCTLLPCTRNKCTNCTLIKTSGAVGQTCGRQRTCPTSCNKRGWRQAQTHNPRSLLRPGCDREAVKIAGKGVEGSGRERKGVERSAQGREWKGACREGGRRERAGKEWKRARSAGEGTKREGAPQGLRRGLCGGPDGREELHGVAPPVLLQRRAVQRRQWRVQDRHLRDAVLHALLVALGRGALRGRALDEGVLLRRKVLARLVIVTQALPHALVPRRRVVHSAGGGCCESVPLCGTPCSGTCQRYRETLSRRALVAGILCTIHDAGDGYSECALFLWLWGAS